MIINFYFSKILIIAFIILIYSNAQTKEEDYIVHSIKGGESVSLICIDYYGHYNNAMGDAIKKNNSSIKDINLIVAGGKLRLRKPQIASKKSDTSPTIFKKKINITQGVVTCVEGKAALTKKGSTKKSKLAANTIVFPGDILHTGSNGRVEIIINRESVVRMKENTRLSLNEFGDKEKKKGKTAVDLKSGTIWTKVKKFVGKICRFECSLPTAIAGVYGTVYQTSVTDDSTSEVKVYNGEVSVKGSPTEKPSTAGEIVEVSGPTEIPGPQEVTLDEWVRIVKSMQKVTIGKDGIPSDVTAFKRKPSSSWEQWNEKRDKRIATMFTEK